MKVPAPDGRQDGTASTVELPEGVQEAAIAYIDKILSNVFSNVSLDKTRYEVIEFEMRPEDLAAISTHYLLNIDKDFRRKKQRQLVVEPLVCIAFAFASLVFSLSQSATVDGQRLLFLLLGLIGFLLALLVYRKRRIQSKLTHYFAGKDRQKLLGKTQLALTDDQVLQTRCGVPSFTPWRSVSAVHSSADYLFGYTKGSLHFLVPRRAFQTEQDFRSYSERVVEMWRKNKDRGPSLSERL